tara:strand:+ start:4068 stop:5276 length:1209 start_codon:yes stop_codon:yes gene_type:complete
MPVKKYISGNIETKSDFYVEFYPKKSGKVIVDVHSKSAILHGTKLWETASATLSDMQIEHGKLIIIDNGGQYFVLQARIESAVKMAYPTIHLDSLPELHKHSTYKSKPDRFRRSRLYIPGNQAKLMLNAGIHKPDAVILDLEDSVSPQEKKSARIIVRNALRQLDFFGAERMVRINQGELGLEDLESIIPHNVHLILVPKVENAAQLKEVDATIQKICIQCKRKEPVFLMPIIESAAGILNCLDIAKASPNNVAIAIGLEDYTADIGVNRTNKGTESLFARSQIVNAARATGIQAIDTVFSDVNDEKALRESVHEAKEIGFDGKGCIHPRQIQPIHEELAPTVVEIERAKKIVSAFNDARKKGLGVVSLGSKMIDPPVVKRAQNTMKLAVLNGLASSNWKAN